MEDLLAAARFAREALEVEKLGLVGLRLGAGIALRALAAGEGGDFLILWEPVLDGKQFMAQNLRRSMIKAMLTKGEEFEAEAVREAHAGEVFDFDGYRITAETRQQIEGMDLLAEAQPLTEPSLVVNLTTREHPADGYVRLAETLGGTAVAVRQEPFWNRIGLVDPRPVIEATELWLAEQQGLAATARPTDSS